MGALISCRWGSVNLYNYYGNDLIRIDFMKGKNSFSIYLKKRKVGN